MLLISKRFFELYKIDIPNNICFISKLPLKSKPVCNILCMVLYFYEALFNFFVDQKLKMTTSGRKNSNQWEICLMSSIHDQKPQFCLNENHTHKWSLYNKQIQWIH